MEKQQASENVCAGTTTEKDKKETRRTALIRSKSKGSFCTLETLHDEEMEAIRREIEAQVKSEEEETTTLSLPSILVRILIVFRILPNERENWTRLHIGLRLAQYSAVLLDLGASIYSVRTFSGISHCCGKPLLNFGDDGGTNWCKVFMKLTYVYMLLVILEIYPVVRTGVPFNLINPPLGFFLTLVLFFDDGRGTAWTLWVVEVLSVLFEFLVLRLKITHQAQTKKEIAFLEQSTTRKMHEHETQEQYKEYIAGATRLLFGLKNQAKKDGRLISILKAGIVLNGILMTFICVVIILVSKAGGLCLNSEMSLNLFSQNQLGRCDLCDNATQVCEVCTEEVEQCYFPYQ